MTNTKELEFFAAVESLISQGLLELVKDETGEVQMRLTKEGADYVCSRETVH